ncbi:12130_t:CDS:1, partial [Racocetra persica]
YEEEIKKGSRSKKDTSCTNQLSKFPQPNLNFIWYGNCLIKNVSQCIINMHLFNKGFFFVLKKKKKTLFAFVLNHMDQINETPEKLCELLKLIRIKPALIFEVQPIK